MDTWLSGEVLILGALFLGAAFFFLLWLEEQRFAENLGQTVRRFFVWGLTIVVAGSFLLNMPLGLGGQRTGRTVTRVGTIFYGFPARSFLIPVGEQTYQGNTGFGSKGSVQLTVSCTLVNATKAKLFSVADAQWYFDSIVVPYGNPEHYFTQALTRAGIDSLCREYALARKAGKDSTTAMQPVRRAVALVTQGAGMKVGKIQITVKEGA